MDNQTPIKPNDRVKAGFTWLTVTSVQGDTVYAMEPGRAPRRLARREIREVDPR